MPTSDPSTMDHHSLLTTLTTIYSRLPPTDLHLLLTLRSLPVHGTPKDLSSRLAHYDISQRRDLPAAPHTPPPSHTPPPPHSPPHPPPHPLPALPPELWADILEFVSDWELARALGVHCSLRPPSDWIRASPLDRAVLTGSVPYVTSLLPRHPASTLTKLGARAVVRFAFLPLLELLQAQIGEDGFGRMFFGKDVSLVVVASRAGRTEVLDWWRSQRRDWHSEYDEEALDEASRKGQIGVLQWWKESGLPLRYGLVMDVASASGQLEVLEWWKNSGEQLEYGKQALRAASYRGHLEVLEWWKRSGLRLIYDKEVLVEATKFNRVEALEWWRRSGLRVEYLLIDIEAALEDAIGGGKEAREWWRKRGVRFEECTVREWMEYKVL